ncbi:MAG: CocE/NonD family hydrolase [Acidobacteriota bacterium]
MTKIRIACLTVVLFFISVAASPRPAQLDLLVDASTHFIRVPADSSEPSEGTIFLAATLYQPRFFPTAPAVVYIHGWGGRRLTGTDNLAYKIAAAGYVVLSYTARGFGGGESGGQVSLAGPNEINDIREIIDWLIADPDRVIGPRISKIGILGASYGGGHGFQTASDERVAAVCALVGWTDLEESLYPNGVINYKLGLAEFYGGLDRDRGQPPFYNYSQLQFDMFDAAAEGRAPDEQVKRKLSNRSIARKSEDGRLLLIDSRKPAAPIFIIQSWDDYLFPATQVMEVYEQISSPKQIYLGRSGHPPGGHSYEGEEIYFGVQVIRWFDHFLRGIGGKDSLSVASASAPFTNTLYNIASLPSKDVEMATFYLKPDGKLLKKKKKKKAGAETAGGIFHRQRIRSSRLGADIPSQADMFSASVETIPGLPRQLVYTLAPWAEDTEIFGSSEMTFYLSSDTSSEVDLIVRSYDVAADGSETEVTIGVMRVSDLQAGETRKVTFRDFGDHWKFVAGHRLRIKISNIDFPDFRPPGTNDGQPSTITLHYGADFPSAVRLPVLKR